MSRMASVSQWLAVADSPYHPPQSGHVSFDGVPIFSSSVGNDRPLRDMTASFSALLRSLMLGLLGEPRRSTAATIAAPMSISGTAWSTCVARGRFAWRLQTDAKITSKAFSGNFLAFSHTGVWDTAIYTAM